MSTIEDFKNAPTGATATHKEAGIRAMRTVSAGRSWVTSGGTHLTDKEMAFQGYTLEPPTPASVREALEIAWELAHEVKEGQVIPVGVWLVDRRDNKIVVEKNTFFSIDVDEWGAKNIRTLEPLHDPEPDWLNAPAVLARLDEWDRDELDVFTPAHEREGRWVVAFSALTHHWSELRDVTPLYPEKTKETEA